ncbi:hypothetical protein AB4084_00325, partial [Lysobacter sp. 2RAB21]
KRCFIETSAGLVLSNDDEYFSSAEISARAAVRSCNHERADGSATNQTRAAAAASTGAPASPVVAQRLPRRQRARCLSSAPLASAVVSRRAEILTNPPDGLRPRRRRGSRLVRTIAAADKRLPVVRAFAKQAGATRPGATTTTTKFPLPHRW